MKLSYTRSGTPEAPAILFLHGNAMGQWMWHDQIQHFADYDCYNVDLPGHSGSNRIVWESFDHSANCVAQLIAEDIPNKPLYIIGMSLGAVVGLHLLARHPAQIKRAVLTGAFAESPPHWQIMLQGQLMAIMLSTRIGKQLYARMLHLSDEIMPAYTASVNMLSIASFKRITQQIATYTLPNALKSVTAPALIVTGEQDIAFNRRSVALLARHMPGAVGAYAPRVHHGWNGEDPALFNQMTRAWLEEQPLPQQLLPVESGSFVLD